MTFKMGNDAKSSADDIILAKRCAELLNKKYPGHLWAVNVNSEQGVLDLKNLGISSLWGFRILLSKVYQDPNLKCLMRGAGEILERAHLITGKKREGEQAEILEGASQGENQLLQLGIVK